MTFVLGYSKKRWCDGINPGVVLSGGGWSEDLL